MDSKVRVMYVEADEQVLESMAAALRTEFQVWVARSAEAGVAVGDELGFDADILVVDLDAGAGMSGREFITEYRRRAQRDVPVVVTGAGRPYEAAQSVTASTYLPKPYSAVELLRVLRLLAHRMRRSQAPRKDE